MKTFYTRHNSDRKICTLEVAFGFGVMPVDVQWGVCCGVFCFSMAHDLAFPTVTMGHSDRMFEL